MAEVLAGIGSLFGAGGAGAASTGAGLGVNTAIAQPTIPTSVMPLSQQIVSMQQPTLTNPMDTIKKGPSLGVDTSLSLGQKPSYNFEQDLQNAAPLMQNILKTAQQNKLSPIQLSAPGQMSSIQQQDLMSLLRNLGGGY
jgi:hypothetical protein